MSKAKCKARKNDLHKRSIPSLSELGHEEPAKEHLLTKSCRDAHSKRCKQVETLRGKSVSNGDVHPWQESKVAGNRQPSKQQGQTPCSPISESPRTNIRE